MTTCSVALFAATDLALRKFSSRSRRCCSADDGNRLLTRKKKQHQQHVTHFLARNREERRREPEPSAKEEIQRRESDEPEQGQNFVRGRSNDRERDGGQAARAAFTCALAASLLCFGTLDFLPELAGEELKRRELPLGVTEFRIHVPHMTMLLNALGINQHAHAAGLFQMPPVRLNNRYVTISFCLNLLPSYKADNHKNHKKKKERSLDSSPSSSPPPPPPPGEEEGENW
jgi:hypothetical protein